MTYRALCNYDKLVKQGNNRRDLLGAHLPYLLPQSVDRFAFTTQLNHQIEKDASDDKEPLGSTHIHNFFFYILEQLKLNNCRHIYITESSGVHWKHQVLPLHPPSLDSQTHKKQQLRVSVCVCACLFCFPSFMLADNKQ